MDADEFLGQVAAPGEHLGIGSSAAAGCCCGGCHGGIFSQDEWHIYHGNKNLNRRTRWAGKKRRHRREKVSKMKATLRGQAGAVPITVNSGNVAGAATRRFDLRNDAPDFGAQFVEDGDDSFSGDEFNIAERYAKGDIEVVLLACVSVAK
jgi:hypothetical protein